MRVARAIAGRVLLAAVVLILLAGVPSARAVYAEQVVHIVQPGDNLYRIGLQYGVSWIDIQRTNQLPSATIYAGQRLIIPVAGSASNVPPADPPAVADPPAAADPPVAATPAPPAASTGTYIVQRGDYLSSIAQRFGLTTAQLAAANNLYNPSLIYAGQTLIIPGAAGSQPPPAAVPASRLILVDLSDQRMYVYQDGALVYNFIVSTGSPGRDTRPGSYSVLNKIPNAYASTWNLWMPNWLGIYWAGSLQNGIHALPILSNGLRLWDGYLGTRVSYGCVILGIADAQTLYDWAEVGVPVTIQY
jgi:LysM repeat protein